MAVPGLTALAPEIASAIVLGFGPDKMLQRLAGRTVSARNPAGAGDSGGSVIR